MVRLLTIVLSILFVGEEAVSKTASLPQHHVVEIRAFRFQPEHMVVLPGDTITWINRDIVPHTVTADIGSWKSEPLREGQSWKVVVENDGVYSYHCEFHPQMKGVLSPS